MFNYASVYYWTAHITSLAYLWSEQSKMDKQVSTVTVMKFKGNQKQFEHNAQIDSMFPKTKMWLIWFSKAKNAKSWSE